MSKQPDPRELHSELVGQRARFVKDRGAEVDTRAIEDMTKRDLELVDRLEANAKPKPKRIKEGRDPSEVSHVAAKMAQEDGYKGMYKRALPASSGLSVVSSPKVQALVMRMHELCRKNDDSLKSLDQRSSFVYPEYAIAITRETADFNLKRRYYRGRSRPEQRRIYFRKIEDICDRSNGIPGLPNWWTK